jgi:hypothetical protein
VSGLICATSAVLDLDSCGMLAAAARAAIDVCVLELLYERELASHGGAALLAAGMRLLDADGEELVLARRFQSARRGLCLCDSISAAVAQRRRMTLISEDQDLVVVAREEGIDTVPPLGLLDRLEACGVVTPEALRRMLKGLAARPTCTISDEDRRQRLERYSH